MKGEVISINISQETGTIKTPITSGEFITQFGLKEDAHAGDWHRQVSLLALESYDKMIVNERLPIGSFAENITTKGIQLYTLPVGMKLQIGETIHEVTQIGKTCHTGCEIRSLVGDCVMPREGIFTRVLQGGIIKKGDAITIYEEKIDV